MFRLFWTCGGLHAPDHELLRPRLGSWLEPSIIISPRSEIFRVTQNFQEEKINILNGNMGYRINFPPSWGLCSSSLHILQFIFHPINRQNKLSYDYRPEDTPKNVSHLGTAAEWGPSLVLPLISSDLN